MTDASTIARPRSLAADRRPAAADKPRRAATLAPRRAEPARDRHAELVPFRSGASAERGTTDGRAVPNKRPSSVLDVRPHQAPAHRRDKDKAGRGSAYAAAGRARGTPPPPNLMRPAEIRGHHKPAADPRLRSRCKEGTSSRPDPVPA